jgi:hypothetical protein
MSTYYDEHKNDPKVWKLHDGHLVSHAGLKSMFNGKIPSPKQRKLLGIEKYAKYHAV